MKPVYESHPSTLQFRSKRGKTPLDLARDPQGDQQLFVGVLQQHRGIVEGFVSTYKSHLFASSDSGRYMVYTNVILVCSRVGGEGV